MPEKRKRDVSPCGFQSAKRQAILEWVTATDPPLSSVERAQLTSPQSEEFGQAALDDDTSQVPSREISQAGSQSVRSAASSRLSPSSSKYETQLRRRNIRDGDKRPAQPDPSNIQELKKLLLQDRASPELEAERHTELRTMLMTAETEDSVMDIAKSHLLKEGWKHQPPSLVQGNSIWDQHVPIRPDLLPQLSDPRPDMAYGWAEDAFHDLDINQALDETYVDEDKKARSSQYQGEERSYQAPSSKLYWPIVTVEGKGPRGTLDEVHLQNSYNAAVMLNNIFQLKRRACRPLPYEQAFVFTVDIVYYIVELTCHWVSIDEDAQDVFWGRVLRCWSLRNRACDQWKAACRSIRNCVEWARETALADIRADLSNLRRIQSQQTTLPRDDLRITQPLLTDVDPLNTVSAV